MHTRRRLRYAAFSLFLLASWLLTATPPVAVSQTVVRGELLVSPSPVALYWWQEAGQAAARGALEGAVTGVIGTLTNMAQAAAGGAALEFARYAYDTWAGSRGGDCKRNPGSCVTYPQSVLD